MMALPHHKKSEGTTATDVKLSPDEKTKASKRKCIFKNHQIDSNCTKTECLLYPKLSCRKFTYTNNADKDVPRCEHLLNRTRCYPSSDLRCNPFQIPLKEIVAQDIRFCAEDSCSNYSLRYIFKNFCKCDMNTLRGLLPSYRGYDNICCKRRNYNGKLADKIDVEKLQMFQKQLAAAVEKAKHSYASHPYGIHGPLLAHRKCKALAQVQLSKDSSRVETNYLFRSQLIEMTKRKFEENKDLIMTKNNVNAVESQNTELPIQLDSNNFQKPTGKEIIYKPEFIPPVFDTFGAEGFTASRKGLTVYNIGTDNGETEFHHNLMKELQVLTDELKVINGVEGEFNPAVHNFGNDEELDFTVNTNSFRELAHDVIGGTEEVDGSKDLSEGAALILNTVSEEKLKTTETKAEETESGSEVKE